MPEKSAVKTEVYILRVALQQLFLVGIQKQTVAVISLILTKQYFENFHFHVFGNSGTVECFKNNTLSNI